MNQHHPDKLVARGMPEEMVEIATRKTQDIKAAYELIKAQKSWPKLAECFIDINEHFITRAEVMVA